MPRFHVERHGQKYLVMELDEGQRPTCGMLMISEDQVAELILFLQTCGETWKVSAPESRMMASRS